MQANTHTAVNDVQLLPQCGYSSGATHLLMLQCISEMRMIASAHRALQCYHRRSSTTAVVTAQLLHTQCAANVVADPTA
eukprot:10286-Heterococcus_DN1.PRE.2